MSFDPRKLAGDDFDDPDVLHDAAPDFFDQFPSIGAILCGLPQDGSKPSLPKQTITLYMESTGLNVAISSKEGTSTIFVRVEDPLTFWMGLESALNSGRFSRKKTAVRKPSY